MSVRLYGRVLGNGSHVQVTRGFAAALGAEQLLAGEYALDFEHIELPPGASARHAIFAGQLNRVSAMVHDAQHRERWTMVAPNSDRVPPKLLAEVVQHSTRLLTPSDWATGVLTAQLTEMGLTCPVMTVPHGLDPAYRVDAPMRQQVRSLYPREFRVLHLSTSDRQRKGTRELLQAWQLAAPQLGPRPQLSLILDPLAENALRSWLIDEGQLGLIQDNVSLHTRVDFEADKMAMVYAVMHVVCQPSRGEAFGLCPLEARASGVPVVMTTCTGHSQHTEPGDPGVVAVPTGPLAPIDDWTDARAPSLDPDELAAALVRCYAEWPTLHDAACAAASELRGWWSWSGQLGPLLQAIKES